MNRVDVTSEWIYSGISDFYFTFCVKDGKFQTYATFFDIMGTEKICKALLLFHNAAIYEGIRKQAAKERIEKKLKNYWGHSLRKMLNDIEGIIGSPKVKDILSVPFDGFTGREFVVVIERGYMESRYPSANPVYREFSPRSAGSGPALFMDPLGSSGLHKFAYRLCQEIFLYLKGNADFRKLRRSLRQLLGRGRAKQRFMNLFFRGNIRNYL